MSTLLQKPTEERKTSPTDSRYNFVVCYLDMNCELANLGTMFCHYFNYCGYILSIFYLA